MLTRTRNARGMKPHSPSCDRNRDPILAVLREHFADRHEVLEIGSGTGQHAVHFAAAMPWLRWQCSDDESALDGIRLWLDEAALPNTPEPFALQATTSPTAGFAPRLRPPANARAQMSEKSQANAQAEVVPRYDAIFSANTLHIMGWPEVEALFAGIAAETGRGLSQDLTLAIYGPFNEGGRYTSDSNRQFDVWLKARDARSGIRDFEAVNNLARAIGLRPIADIAMPANNRMLVWRRL
jgi:Protein of unknown function (DUF938)